MTGPAGEAQQVLQDLAGQVRVQCRKQTPRITSSCPFVPPPRHRSELGFPTLLGNSHFPSSYMGFSSETPRMVGGTPGFLGFRLPSLEGKSPNRPQL